MKRQYIIQVDLGTDELIWEATQFDPTPELSEYLESLLDQPVKEPVSFADLMSGDKTWDDASFRTMTTCIYQEGDRYGYAVTARSPIPLEMAKHKAASYTVDKNESASFLLEIFPDKEWEVI